jgi:hypothetical protein
MKEANKILTASRETTDHILAWLTVFEIHKSSVGIIGYYIINIPQNAGGGGGVA